MKSNRGSLTITVIFTILIFTLYGVLLYARSASAYIRQSKSIETIQRAYTQDIPNAAIIAQQLGGTETEVFPDNSIISLAQNGTLQVGQYVNYLYDDAEDYEIPSAASGYIIDEDATVSQNVAQIKNLNWRIWNLNEDGSVDLVGEMKGSNVVGFRLQGAEGYNNGVFLLNDVCQQHYSNQSYGILARNMNIEDIEKCYNEEGIDARNSFEDTRGTYGQPYTYNGSKTYPILLEHEKGFGIGTTTVRNTGIGRSDGYYVSLEEILSQSLSTANTESGVTGIISTYVFTLADLVQYTNKPQSLFYDGKPYYLASRAASTYGSSFFYLGFQYITNDGIRCSTVFTGAGANTTNTYSIRPIVTIPARFKIDIQDTTKDGTTAVKAWTLYQ